VKYQLRKSSEQESRKAEVCCVSVCFSTGYKSFSYTVFFNVILLFADLYCCVAAAASFHSHACFGPHDSNHTHSFLMEERDERLVACPSRRTVGQATNHPTGVFIADDDTSSFPYTAFWSAESERLDRFVPAN